MNNEDQILAVLASIQADIADLKERQVSTQADIAALKDVKDIIVNMAAKFEAKPDLVELELNVPENDLASSHGSDSASETAIKYWTEALPLLQNSFSDVVFSAWIEPLAPYSYNDNIFILKTNRDFAKATVNDRYLFEITKCIRAVIGHDVDVRIVSPDDFEPNDNQTLRHGIPVSEVDLCGNQKEKLK